MEPDQIEASVASNISRFVQTFSVEKRSALLLSNTLLCGN